MTTKWVYSFSQQFTEGDKSFKNLLGGKGANLAEMCNLKMPIPPGFTVSTEACIDYYRAGQRISEEVKSQVKTAMAQVEKMTGKKFGDAQNPLLFSVRSGARVSMPGMMDTVLNLGLNDSVVVGLAKKAENERFAWDSYRRFIQMYADVVMGVDSDLFEHALEQLKQQRKAAQDTDLSADDFKELVATYKQSIQQASGQLFPNDPWDQLFLAVGAVFKSWNNERAKIYRQMHGYSADWGTAVNVQSMVFGNMGEDCATGVCFTRDPSTGAKKFFGEFLVNAQGEDVVAGIRTPMPINDESKNDTNCNLPTLSKLMPDCYQELVKLYQQLERHYKDMQDIEFTIENRKLYLLQTRNGKRTTAAAVKIAVDLVNEKLLTREEALLKVDAKELDQLLHPRLDPLAPKKIIAKGLPASPGAACGQIVVNAADAKTWADNGKAVILVRVETSPEDIQGMFVSKGILTTQGGMTSHAAVVARGMGTPCVSGCSAVLVNYREKTVTIAGHKYQEGDWITLDGSTGEIMDGKVPTIPAEINDDFAVLMGWADQVRRLRVRTNADTPDDSEAALKFGAEGIGLCRTEHMFFAPERILAVREMIFAKDTAGREKALAKLLPFQKQDFLGIFQAMAGKPVNIRLLDPPLHEFLPHERKDKEELAKSLQLGMEEVEQRLAALHEFNPMLGHRGCRLGISYPEIYKMQVRAIVEAAVECASKGISVYPEIMIPLVAMASELKVLREDAEAVAQAVFQEKGKTIKLKIGTMIELPRAAVTAGKIASHADFFSFGTNDLTQTTYGLSRDDGGKFLPDYLHRGHLLVDPFVELDTEGVGFLINHACTSGKATNSNMHLGICGEHGGNPASVEFCHRIGLDYVSCSPFRVPIARLAAAQAVARETTEKVK